MFRTKREATALARRFQQDDHAAGLTERRWEARKAGRSERRPWIPVCVVDDHRAPKPHRGPRIPGLNA